MTMAVMPLAADTRDLCIAGYSAAHARYVQSWIRSDRELLWLAPATPPPVTAEKVDGWSRADQHRFLLWNAPLNRPVGYAELDFLSPARDQMWIGHFILAPQVRGCGLSLTFASTLLHLAFDRFEAARVLLLVFPDNAAAVRCYTRVGFTADGEERKQFEHDDSVHVLLRMVLDRARYRRLAGSAAIPPRHLPLISGSVAG